VGQTLKVVQGADIKWNTVFYNAGVPVSYVSNATFTATVSRGAEEASLFSPTVTWINSTLGSASLAIGAAQTASLDPGIYNLLILIVAGGLSYEAFNGQLEILPNVGSITPPIVWCDESDVVLYWNQGLALQPSRLTNDATGFLLQRIEATQKVSRMLVVRYNPMPGFTLTRQNTVDSIVGMDVATPSAVPPSKYDLTQAVNATGGIVLEEKLREIVARRAIALLMRRQATGGSGREYMAEAEAQVAMSDMIFECYEAQMVSAYQIPLLSGITNFLIHCNCIVLPPGTSP
jgi:hypothetical protein